MDDICYMKNNLQEEMALHIEQWSSSGLSRATYCKNAGLSYHKFNYHFNRSEKKKENPSSGFAMLETKSSEPGRIEFHLPNGCYFSLPADCPVMVLEKLVRVC